MREAGTFFKPVFITTENPLKKKNWKKILLSPNFVKQDQRLGQLFEIFIQIEIQIEILRSTVIQIKILCSKVAEA